MARFAEVRGRSRLRVVIGVCVAATVLVVPAPAGAAGRREARERAREAPSPKHWDPQIRPLVDFVERTRHLTFEQVVPVRFDAGGEIRRLVGPDEASISRRDRAEADRLLGQLRALALAEGTSDALSLADAFSNDVLGMYDPVSRRILVRSRDVRHVEARMTVVHELVHALQDQHFGLLAVERRASSWRESLAVRALIEGDATLVEYAYLGTLPTDEYDAYVEQGPDSGSAGEADDATSEVPPVLDAWWTVPYSIGPAMVATMTAADHHAVDERLRARIGSDAGLVDPVSALHPSAPVVVERPRLSRGEARSGPADSLGALTVYLMVASRIDEATALRAATAYGGDRAVGFRKDGRECLRIRFRGTDRRGTRRLGGALQRWVATLPSGMATVATARRGALLTSCETPGAGAPSTAVLEQALTVTLVNRHVATRSMMEEAGLGVRVARCVADAIVLDADAGPTFERMLRDSIGVDDLSESEAERFAAVTTTAVVACRFGARAAHGRR